MVPNCYSQFFSLLYFFIKKKSRYICTVNQQEQLPLRLITMLGNLIIKIMRNKNFNKRNRKNDDSLAKSLLVAVAVAVVNVLIKRV